MLDMSDLTMNYYEEFGLPISASPREIQRAHRILCRLLHPDLQSDGEIRRLAELQMARINGIAATLLNPDQRRKYDETLLPVTLQPHSQPGVAPPPPHSVSLFAFAGIVLSAVVLTVFGIWLVASDFMHWRTSGSSSVSASTTAPPSPRRSSPARSLAPVPPKRPRLASSTPQVDPPPSDPLPSPAERSGTFGRADEPAPAARSSSQAVAAHRASAVPRPPAQPELLKPEQESPSPKELQASPLAGLWLLPASRKKSSASRYTPQFIQLSIYARNGMLYGDYSARYEIPDRAISPEVVFAFEGQLTGDSPLLTWTAADGSKGEIELKLLTPESMHVAWQVSEFGSNMGVAGGASVVIRRAE